MKIFYQQDTGIACSNPCNKLAIEGENCMYMEAIPTCYPGHSDLCRSGDMGVPKQRENCWLAAVTHGRLS